MVSNRSRQPMTAAMLLIPLARAYTRGAVRGKDTVLGCAGCATGVVVARMPFSRKKHNENNAFRIF